MLAADGPTTTTHPTTHIHNAERCSRDSFGSERYHKIAFGRLGACSGFIEHKHEQGGRRGRLTATMVQFHPTMYWHVFLAYFNLSPPALQSTVHLVTS